MPVGGFWSPGRGEWRQEGGAGRRGPVAERTLGPGWWLLTARRVAQHPRKAAERCRGSTADAGSPLRLEGGTEEAGAGRREPVRESARGPAWWRAARRAAQHPRKAADRGRGAPVHADLARGMERGAEALRMTGRGRDSEPTKREGRRRDEAQGVLRRSGKKNGSGKGGGGGRGSGGRWKVRNEKSCEGELAFIARLLFIDRLVGIMGRLIVFLGRLVVFIGRLVVFVGR